MLADFCVAHYGAPAIQIIREAVKSFISQRIAQEPELRSRYDAAKRERLSAKLKIIAGSTEEEGEESKQSRRGDLIRG